MLTPLQPKEFFRGVWKGDGELVPHPLLRWFAARERVAFSSECIRLTDTVWLVHDHFGSSSGWRIERKMFAELQAPDRLHVTADDMPGGADVLLHERGFRFTPYSVLGVYRAWTFSLRCLDVCTLDDDGCLHDVLRMFWCGFPVATMKLGPVTITRQ